MGEPHQSRRVERDEFFDVVDALLDKRAAKACAGVIDKPIRASSRSRASTAARCAASARSAGRMSMTAPVSARKRRARSSMRAVLRATKTRSCPRRAKRSA